MSQADAARITGDPVVVGGNSVLSTGKIKNAAVLSRRAAIAALAVAPMAAAAASVAVPVEDSWTLALRRFRKAEAEYNTHVATSWNPLHEELEKLCPLPPHSVSSEPRPGFRVTFIYNSQKPDAWMWQPTVEGRRIGEKLSAEYALWRETYSRESERLGEARIQVENDRLYDAMNAAKDQLMLMSAPDAAAVLTKIELMWENKYAEREEENEHLIIRDLRAIVETSGVSRAA